MNSSGLLVLAPLAYVAAVIEVSLGDLAAVGPVAPDLLALTAFVWLWMAGGPHGFLAAGAIGLFGDLISPGPVGLGAAAYLVVGYGLGAARQRTPADVFPVQVAAIGAAVAALGLAMACGHWLLGESSLCLATLSARAVGVGLYTAGVAVPALMVVGWLREPILARRRRLADL